MGESIDVVLTGGLLPGFERQTVCATLARLMRISEDRAALLLAGSETVIKRGLGRQQVEAYLKAIQAAGAAVRVEGLPAQAAEAAPAAPSLELVPKPEPVAEAPAPAENEMTCPACGAVQPKRNLCRSCGVDMPRMLAAKEAEARAPAAAAVPAAASVRATAGKPRVEVDDGSFTPPPLSFSLEGRVGRLRYLAYSLPAYLPLIAAAVIVAIILGGVGRSMGILAIMVVAAGCISTFWLGVRNMVLRLHDLNRSGKWVLLPLLPLLLVFTGSPVAAAVAMIAIGIASLLLCVLPGNPEDNDYGSPAGPNTIWTIIGAAIVILLAVANMFADHSRFAPRQPN
ncbi:MAG: DUF805 domain-containing protein, partial [Rhodocyclaceae bacterium]